MDDDRRADRQVDLFAATQAALFFARPKLPEDVATVVVALLVVAARLEEFCDTWAENIHRAGEGI